MTSKFNLKEKQLKLSKSTIYEIYFFSISGLKSVSYYSFNRLVERVDTSREQEGTS